jgi:hypothetical protein
LQAEIVTVGARAERETAIADCGREERVALVDVVFLRPAVGLQGGAETTVDALLREFLDCGASAALAGGTFSASIGNCRVTHEE